MDVPPLERSVGKGTSRRRGNAGKEGFEVRADCELFNIAAFNQRIKVSDDSISPLSLKVNLRRAYSGADGSVKNKSLAIVI